MSDKLLSIIVPAYNMEAFLPKCLGSLVFDGVLFQQLDVLVVNVGSKDKTSEIAHDFSRRYPGVFRVVNKCNSHYGSCVNCGLNESVGRYVKILDADDCFDTEGLAQFVDYLSRHDDDLILSDFVMIDATDQVLARREYPRTLDIMVDNLLSEENPLQHHAITYKTQLLRRIEYRQSEGVAYSDAEWCIYPISGVGTISHSGCTVYRYLLGREGQSVSQYHAKIEDLKTVLANMMRNFSHYSQMCINERNQVFVARRILDNLRFVAEVIIANAKLCDLKREFRELCKLAEDCQELYTQFMRMTILRKAGNLKLFRLMRNHFLLALPLVLIYRLRLRVGGGR